MVISLCTTTVQLLPLALLATGPGLTVAATTHADRIQLLLQELQDGGLDCAMAQHLLVAADRYEMPRLRRICERRLTETIDVSCLVQTLGGNS